MNVFNMHVNWTLNLKRLPQGFWSSWMAKMYLKQSVQSELVSTLQKLQWFQSLDKHYLKDKELFAQSPGLVADGRDMATSIFPGANAKIYLTASAESRAERRVKQLQGMGLDAKINDILANIQARDKRDMEREVAPLKPAKDAYIIDSSELTIDQVFKLMVDYVDSRTI